MSPDEQPELLIESAEEWERWLAEQPEDSPGVWLKLGKKGKGVPVVPYAVVLDAALCHGWIDGQRRALDDTHFLQKFTPRRPRSVW
ncbi:MAG: YdeI/OmpD-associated family protein, partial [Thermoleophilaceae bacterium]